MGNTQFNNRIAYLINFLSVVIFIYCGAHYVVRNWFTVNKIVIEVGSVNHITPVQLSYIAHNKLHGTFFTLDIQELKSEFEELPWVSDVSVKRHFHTTVEVTLKEYKSYCVLVMTIYLQRMGGFDGADDSLDLPTFYVPLKSSDDALKRYLQIESVLDKHGDKLNKLWLTLPRVTKFTTVKI